MSISFRLISTAQGIVWNTADWSLEYPIQVRADIGQTVLLTGKTLIPISASTDGSSAETYYEDKQSHLSLLLHMRAHEEGILVQARLHNYGADSVFVRDIVLTLSGNGELNSGIDSPDWRVFVDSGNNAWCGVKRLNATRRDPELGIVETQRSLPVEEAGEDHHSSDLVTVLFEPSSRRGFLFGCVRALSTMPFIEVVPDAMGRRVQRVELRAAHNAEVSPGAVLETDPLLLLAGSDPLSLLETYARVVKQFQQRSQAVLLRQPIVGYLTWYGYGTAVSEQAVLSNARACGEIFGGYPQHTRPFVMLIDHGWQWRANWGKWDEADPDRFPSGIAKISEQLREMGWQLGLWYTPTCVTADSPDLPRLTPMLARDAKGQPIKSYASVWGYTPDETSVSRDIFFLDCALPETLAEISSNVRRMKSWGTALWKMDFYNALTSASNTRRFSRAQLYERLGACIREAAGAEAIISPCSTPTNRNLGKCDTINIPADLGNAGKWPATKRAFRRSWETSAANWFKHGAFWINDHQSIQLDEGCSLGEARIRSIHVAFSGAGFWLGEDVSQMPVDRRFMVQRLLPVYGRAARPLDLFDNPYPDSYHRLWALSVETDWDRWTAIAVFNFDDQPYAAQLDAELFGIAPDVPFEAMEWWSSRRLGQHTNRLVVHVPPEDVVVILAKPRRDYPWVLGTDLHFTGGWIIENVRWDAERLTLCGEIVTKPGLHGNLYGMHPSSFTINPRVTQLARDNGSGGWHYRFQTTGARTPFEIPFTRLDSAQQRVS